MKLVEGGILSGRVAELVKDPKAAARLIAAVARAVHHAHQRGILHRDLKPGNVLLDGQGQPHVTDFGLAKRTTAAGGLTQSNAIVGTPAYMAPEQARAEKRLSTAVDVYSLGAILYECLTGRPPFQAATAYDTLLQVVEKEPERPRTVNPRVDRDLETICLKCLEKDPGRRYGSAEALAEDLERWQRGEPIQARPTTRWERAAKWARRKPAAAALVGVSAAAALLVAGLLTWFLTALYAHSRELAKERDKAREEEGNARQAEQRAKVKESEAATSLDRTRRVLMTSQLLNVASIYQQNPLDALALLENREACPLEWRDDFAWRYYHSRCQRWRLTWKWPEGAIDALAVSPDGELLATSTGKVITLWELSTGKQAAQLEGHTLTVRRLRFTPDSRVLASAAHDVRSKKPPAEPRDAEVKVWDLTTRKVRFDLSGKEKDLTSLSLSADGKALAAGYGSGSARVWEVASGRELAHLPEVGRGVALSPDGTRIVAEAEDKEPDPDPRRRKVSVWNVRKKQLTQTIRLDRESESLLVGWTFIEGGKGLAAVDVFNTGIRIWDLQTGKKQHLLTSHSRRGVVGMSRRIDPGHDHWFEERMESLAPDGKALATLVPLSIVLMGADLVVWDVERRQEQVAIRGQRNVEAVSFTNNGKGLAVVQRSDRGATTLRIWSLAPTPGHLFFKEARGAAFLPDGKSLVTAIGNTLKRIDLVTGREEHLGDAVVQAGQKREEMIFVLAASPDGKSLALCNEFDRGILWDMPSRRPRFTFKGVGHAIRFSPDGTLLITGEGSDPVVDVSTGAKARRLPTTKKNQLAVAAFTPDGQTLAVGGPENPLQLWDLRTGQTRRTLSRPLLPLHYLPDGNLLVVLSFEGGAPVHKLWDVDKDQEHSPLGRFPMDDVALVRYLFLSALSPDGKALATADLDAEIRDTATGQVRLKLPVTRPALLLAFSPDARFLAVSDYSGVRVWDTRPVKETVIGPGR
jgi:WD40 repeat protein